MINTAVLSKSPIAQNNPHQGAKSTTGHTTPRWHHNPYSWTQAWLPASSKMVHAPAPIRYSNNSQSKDKILASNSYTNDSGAVTASVSRNDLTSLFISRVYNNSQSSYPRPSPISYQNSSRSSTFRPALKSNKSNPTSKPNQFRPSVTKPKTSDNKTFCINKKNEQVAPSPSFLTHTSTSAATASKSIKQDALQGKTTLNEV